MPETTKVCTRCGEEKPATEEFFYRASVGGWRSYCKVCSRLAGKRYYANHTEEKHQYYETNIERIGQYRRKWQDQNRERIREDRRRYCEENPDKIILVNRQQYLANRDERLAYQRRYRVEHPESAEAVRRWAQEHSEMIRAYSRNRKARERSAGGSHSGDDVLAQYERQQGRCFYCNRKVGDHYEIDHVMPLVLGGSNGPENLVVACPRCNRSKGAKHPAEFAGVMF